MHRAACTRRAGGNRRRLAATLAVLVAGLLAAGCATSPGPPPGPAGSGSPASSEAAPAPASGPAPVTLAGFYAQKLRWQPCDNGFRCARLFVPFDYRRPAWRAFSLPVIMRPAASPAKRIGSLVINPGGPGASGISYALSSASQFPAAIRDRFSIVGFDPRGVGGSEPAVHCLTGRQLDRFFQTDDAPRTAAQLSAVVAENKFYAVQCEKNSGALLPYVGTRDAARDMDVLRAALGDAKLTYLGKSYGSYLGTWYAQLFPDRVRALVLDGAVDPGTPALTADTVQAQAARPQR